jgi:ribosome-associated protein
MRSGRGACSSAVEHGAHNPRVAGSIPAGPTRRETMVPIAQYRLRGGCGIDAYTDSQVGDHVGSVGPDPGLPASRELALRIADVIADTPAADTRVLEIHALTTIADYFVVCSGANERQLRAINREVLERLSEGCIRPIRSEGDAHSGWILLDYGGIIVHIFDAEQRAYYRLEDMWAAAATLLAIQ